MAPTDYGSNQTEGMEQVSEMAREAGSRAVSLTEDVADAIREHPYTTLAVAAGLAFAIGALWKLGQSRPQTRLDTLLGHLPQLPGRDSLPAGASASLTKVVPPLATLLR